MNLDKPGNWIYELVKQLFPICRSITGDGIRQSLQIIQSYLPCMTLHEVVSGTTCFDWVVPKEWNIQSATLIDPDGNKVVDFADHNLHVVGYSIPVDRYLPLEELQQHLHSIPDMPEAIPYATSYYHEDWGFCLPHQQRKKLKPGLYHARINSTLSAGSLTYGDLVIPGVSKEEIFLSTYICHPSMANNELSGPAVCVALAQWVKSLPQRRYTYRFVFVPETIGALVYLSKHLEHLRSTVIAGFVVTCVGDERTYSYLESRLGGTQVDRVAKHVLKHVVGKFDSYSFLERGSDERQYCAPGVDLPMVSVMRSKYGTYPEYHTSLDDLSLVTPEGLQGSYTTLRHCLEVLEADVKYRTTVTGEPQLGRRGLYHTLATRGIEDAPRIRLDLLAYADGQHSLLEIAEKLNVPLWNLIPFVNELVNAGLLVR